MKDPNNLKCDPKQILYSIISVKYNLNYLLPRRALKKTCPTIKRVVLHVCATFISNQPK